MEEPFLDHPIKSDDDKKKTLFLNADSLKNVLSLSDSISDNPVILVLGTNPANPGSSAQLDQSSICDYISSVSFLF